MTPSADPPVLDLDATSGGTVRAGAATLPLRAGHSLPSSSPTSGTAAAGGWRPVLRLGAAAEGGLSLPAAHPTASWLYAPRGVWFDDDSIVAADSGNHRLLIWHGWPTDDGAPADVVLCQPDTTSEGPAAGGRGPSNGVHLPTGVTVHEGRLIVADAWHHRVLVWDHLPTAHDTPPDAVIGQVDMTSVEPNRGGEPTAMTLYWPYGIGVVAGTFWICDTGNRRVLGWHDGPPVGDDLGRPPDVVLGQEGPTRRDENRGGDVAADSFRWPHDMAGDERVLLVADAGNHRVLGWTPAPTEDRPADLVLGQADMTAAVEWPYGPHSADGHRFPYGISSDGATTALADTANNRLLVFDHLPTSGGASPVHVLAQPDFTSNGENRWDLVADDTLCRP